MTARDVVLARVREAIAGQVSEAAVVREYRRRGGLDPADRVRLLCERVEEYRAEIRCVGGDEVPAAIAEVCAARQARRVVVPPGLPAEWRSDALELVEDGGLTPHELDRVDGVVTGCTLAIAETGTLVLTGGPAEGRRAITLVPDLHVCVVRGEQIVELVPEAIARLGEIVRGTRRPVTFISGPSATSDIELSRVEGVHGPRSLVVLVVRLGSIP